MELNNNVQKKRKVTKHWDKTETKLLISEFESKQDLWDPSRASYSDRFEKMTKFFSMMRTIKIAFFFRSKRQKMLEEIGIVCGVSSQDVSAKIHSLRTQFNRECAREKKAKSGSASDENYVSKWEYMSSLRFLKINSVDSVTVSNLVMLITFFWVCRHYFNYFCFFQDQVTPELFDDLSNGLSSETESLISIDIENDISSEQGPSSGRNKRHVVPSNSSKKAKKRQADDTNDDMLLEKALAAINQPNDELDVFGQFVSSEMRQISDLTIRNLIKSEIMKVFIQYSTSTVVLTTDITDSHLENEKVSTKEYEYYY